MKWLVRLETPHRFGRAEPTRCRNSGKMHLQNTTAIVAPPQADAARIRDIRRRWERDREMAEADPSTTGLVLVRNEMYSGQKGEDRQAGFVI